MDKSAIKIFYISPLKKNGLMFTYDENKQEKKCLFNKGLFGEIMRTGKPINSNSYISLIIKKKLHKKMLRHIFLFLNSLHGFLITIT